ncbi:MAG TPA: hypothetical protein VH352_14535 [Pseudonocardiaceae bacterium]|nr:hypothetical protein [Pseudonocardiaceae bacterium]
MDRPNNGHRRHETGSVTVVDLIRRQQGPVRIPSADEAATEQFVTDLLGRPIAHGIDDTDFPEQRGWLARSAKLAGLALGSLALCGSMIAASALTHHRTQTAAAKPATVLTGVGALRPDTVAAQLSGKRPAPPPARRDAPTVASGRATGTIVGHTPPTAAAPPPPQAAASGPTPSAADVVRVFYRLVGSDPNLAAELIQPALLAADSTGFVQAWSSMSRIEIESIQQVSKESVQAVIRMMEPDGTWLRVVELLHVTDSSTPLIDGAELLSAQRG